MVHGYSIREKQFILLKYCITEVAPIFRNHGSKRLDWWLNLSRNTQITKNKFLILLLINIVLLIVGCFLESIAAIVIMTPVLFPISTALGLDPIHFGIIVCVNICIGTLTPPFGVCLFVSSGLTQIPIERIAKKSMPFLLALIICLLLVTYVEPISMFLPRLLAGR